MKTKLNIGDYVDDIRSGDICTTYPLIDFKYYINQERNNKIRKGVIIDIIPNCVSLPTILVEFDGKVVAVRTH